jgi:4-hydroxyphenylacetaldehyde oxime monooxygenase
MATVALLEGRTADDVNMNEEGRLVCHRKTPLVLVPTVYRRGVKI